MPEIAARAHVELLDPAISQALTEAGLASTRSTRSPRRPGPGLIGGLIVGVMTGKAIALARGLPFIAVNHLEAHALTAGLTDGLEFPYLLLLVSGGHTQLLDRRRRRALSAARHDDRRCARRGVRQGGEAAGPRLSRRARGRGMARRGKPDASNCRVRCSDGRSRISRLPASRPRSATRRRARAPLERAGRRRSLRELPGGGHRDRRRSDAGGIASFIESSREAGRKRAGRGRRRRRQSSAASGAREIARGAGLRLFVPPPELCTDNAAMMAWAGPSALARTVDDLAPPPRRAGRSTPMRRPRLARA